MGGKGSGGNHGAKGVPYEHNPLMQARDPANVDPVANSKVARFGAWLMELESPDYGSERAMKERFWEYLGKCEELGIKPMVTSMAQAFGMNRDAFSRIARGDRAYANWHDGALTPESTLVVTKAYEFLNMAWETYLVDEKGNPVKWIFLGKNYFGMRDVSEHVQVRADVTPQLTSPDELRDKYGKMVGKPQQTLTEGVIESIEDVPES